MEKNENKSEKKEKERLDVLLVKLGLASSRELAKAYIMEGLVYVGGVKEEKPGRVLDANTPIECRAKQQKFVSRGGYKLEKAMEEFGLKLSGKCCMDIGASTGGFTDCMLQYGAQKVISVDVGYGQLAWKLRTDERVSVMEKTNIRYLTPDKVPYLCDFASIDVSFISLTKVIPAVLELLKEESAIVALIKPQFEAGKGNVGKKGVVRDPAVHMDVIEKILEFSDEKSLAVAGLTFSPVKGPEGNIEYLVLLEKGASKGIAKADYPGIIRKTVELAHNTLN